MTELHLKEVPPDQLNGYDVLCYRPRPGLDGAYYVLCYKPAEHARFVVATWSPHHHNEWFWGHYFVSLPDAMEAF